MKYLVAGIWNDQEIKIFNLIERTVEKISLEKGNISCESIK